MRIADVAKLFAGSCIVYLVVAACSAYSEEPGGTSGAPPTPTTSPTNPVPNAFAEGHKSGTRLKLRFYEGSDGSRQFIDFWDSELKTICRNGFKTSDGKLRCLPATVGEIYYSDTQCKIPLVLRVDKTVDPQPTIAVVYVAGVVTEHYALKGLVNAPAVAVYQGGKDGTGQNGMGCGLTTLSVGNVNYYEVGTPLAPAAFVEVAIKNE